MIINPDTIRDDTSTFTQFLAVEDGKAAQNEAGAAHAEAGKPRPAGPEAGMVLS